jgi:hypothetical protein
MDASLAAVDHIIEQVRALPHLDRAAVERIVGAKLDLKRSLQGFEILEARNVRAGPLELRAELRQSTGDARSSSGSLLIMEVTSGCARREDVLARYGPLELTDVPRGRSLDEKISWSREEPWGKLSFGFAEKDRDCLRSVAFNVH